MTAHGDVPMAVKAMKAGAVDFLEKPIEPEHLVEALQRHMAPKAATSSGSASAETAEFRGRFAKLTPREKEVLAHLVKGSPNKVIAYEMQISPRTVELHRAHVMQKMEASSLSHLVRMALAIGVEHT
jgi:two-component system response regulator FixJ